jgi:4-hydroxythreonine-4-phosphate dehydrogenase
MENEIEYQSEKVVPVTIGISHGDVNSISYEVILKSLTDSRILEYFTPIIYGASKVASYHRKALDMAEINFNVIRSADQAASEKINVINVINQEIKVELGQCNETGGQAAFTALEAATKDLSEGLIEALVTGPISKQNIQSKDFDFPGHTEYLAQKFKTQDYLMLMVYDFMRIGVITGHVPIKDVPGLITKELILHKLRIMNQSLLRDFGIRKPRIAIMGLNPHAGDNGVLGNEEQTVIIPAIQKAFGEGIMAFGPYPADGFFGSSKVREFDGILAMYHDQGLIPFKTMAYRAGVNYTAGLPIVRTSPAHGTAFEIAGKNLASADSFREALYLARDIVQNRKIHDEITANPLKFSALEADSDADKNALKSLKDSGDEPGLI